MKRQTTTIFMLLATMIATANPIGRQQARVQAQAFMEQRGIQIQDQPLRAPGRVAMTDTEPLYVFNSRDGHGFVIISGDDRTDSVLGYTEQGCYDDSTLPENFKAWLMQAAEEIEGLGTDIPDSMFPVSASPQRAPHHVKIHNAILPLIRTAWNQGSTDDDYPNGYIYNTMTPTLNGKHCLTGCVATAGAQIMYYYQHPKTATQPVPGYNWRSQNQELTGLPATTFRWADMKTTYSYTDQGTVAETAVSELMLYCGWAARMNYGIDISDAQEYTMACNMVDYFDYDPYTLQSVNREAYSICEWDSIIYHELAEQRPIIVSGNSWLGGGHAFLCDGYDGEGFYHFNWGWGGSSNGYFKLHVTNPYGGTRQDNSGQFHSGYILKMNAIIGLQPRTGIIPPEDPEEDRPVNDENDTWKKPEPDGIVATVYGTAIEGTKVTMQIGNGNTQAYGFGYGIGELQKDGTITPIDERYKSYSSSPLSTGWYYSLSFNFDTYDLPKGTHTLVPISMRSGENIWRRCLPLDLAFQVTVGSNNNITIQKSPVVALEVSNLRCYTSRLLSDDHQYIAFDVENLGDNFDGRIYLFASQTEEKIFRNYIDLKMLAGATKQRTIYWPLSSSDATGTYNIWVATDYYADNVLAHTTAELVDGLVVTSFTCNTSRQPGAQQTVTCHLQNPGGPVSSALYFFASQTESSKGSYKSRNSVVLKEGDEADVNFTFTPDAFGTYYVWICTDQNGTSVLAQSTVKIENNLEVAQFNFPGTLFKGSLQCVVATVSSLTEYAQPLYLFANKWENMKGAAIYCAPTAIEAGQTEDVTFYFKPQEAADYFIWICTDKSGNHVVGQTKVTVQTSPNPTTLACTSASVAFIGTTAQVTFTITNTGNTLYFNPIIAWLYERETEPRDDGRIYSVVMQTYTSEELRLQPGSSQTFVAEFKDLEPGRYYYVRWRYVSSYSSDNLWSTMSDPGLSFTVPEPTGDIAQLACVSTATQVSTTTATALLTVENIGTVTYANVLRAELRVKETETLVTAKNVSVTNLQPGQRLDVSAQFTGLEPGTEYYVQWYYRPYTDSPWVLLNGSLTTPVEELPSGMDSTTAPYFTLSGIRINTRPNQPGVYVNRGRKVVIAK